MSFFLQRRMEMYRSIKTLIPTVLISVVCCGLGSNASAQMVTTTAGFQNLNSSFSQGSNRSISSTTASLTTMDGYPGSFSSGVIRPFVTSVVPVVGGYPTIIDPSQISRQIGQQQLASLRQSNAARVSKKLGAYLRRGELAESEGKKRMARANYRSAIALAPQPLRGQIQRRLAAMMRKR